MSETAASTSGLFYSGHVPQNVDEVATLAELDKNRGDAYDTAATIEWVKQNGYKRIALQFPDELLGGAVPVAQEIELAFDDVKTFILADTSYRSCCVDEVAARHASCDALVHYGDACLSAPTQAIPVRYALPRWEASVPALEVKLSSMKDSLPSAFLDSSTVAVLVTDSPYAWNSDSLSSACSSVLGRPVLPCGLPSRFSESAAHRDTAQDTVSLGRVLPPGFDTAESAAIIFVGSKDSPLLQLWLLSHPHITVIAHFDPVEGTIAVEEPLSWRALRRRLFLVEKVRDAHTLGLVVGTVAVAGHREAVQRVRALAKQQGKKVYVISVGKVNVAKLANFSADIDCFVLLSCPFGVLLDTSSFDKPVVSLFEAEIALNPEKNWMAERGWTSSFGDFVRDPMPSEATAEGGDEDETPDMSLVSGRVRVRPERTVDASNDEHGGSGTVALYTAGDYFAARSWRGLDDSVKVTEGEEESVTVTEGRKGRAAGYENEPGK